jgi:hypothetical protein
LAVCRHAAGPGTRRPIDEEVDVVTPKRMAALRDRVSSGRRERRERKLQRALQHDEHQRGRERRGEVGRGGVGENGGWSGGTGV